MSLRTVKNPLVNALLEAIYDVLDYDGRRSIIDFAHIEYMANKLPSDGQIPMSDFYKLINAMNILLAYSKTVMYEIGRKFSFYLSPFGVHFMEFIDLIEDNLVGETIINIEYPSENEIDVYLKQCPFCKGLDEIFDGDQKTEGFSCEFFRGLLDETLKKSINQGVNINVFHIEKNSEFCKFQVITKNKPM